MRAQDIAIYNASPASLTQQRPDSNYLTYTR